MAFKVKVARLLCSRTAGRIIGSVFDDRIPAAALRVRTDSPHVQPQTKASIFWRLYERAELRMVRKGLRGDLDIIELGASIGVVGAHARAQQEPGKRYLAVEANPRLFDLLRINLDATSRGQVDLINAAVLSGPNVPPEIDLAIGDATTGSRLNPANELMATAAGEILSVPCISLSKLIDEFALGDYAMICDIEGAELSILLHEEAALAHCKQLLIELHTSYSSDGQRYSPEMMRELLEQTHGFRVFKQRGNVVLYER